MAIKSSPPERGIKEDECLLVQLNDNILNFKKNKALYTRWSNARLLFGSTNDEAKV